MTNLPTLKTPEQPPNVRGPFARAGDHATDIVVATGFGIAFVGAAIGDLAVLGYDAAREKLTGKPAKERGLFITRIMGAPD